MPKEKQIDIGKLQGELYKLCEKRLRHLDNKTSIEADLEKSKAEHDSVKSKVKADLKSIQKELVAIDQLMREKIDAMNKYR